MRPFEGRSVPVEDDQVQIQQELEKLEAAIERLLLQDPNQTNTSCQGKQPQQHHEQQLDKSGERFISGIRRRSGPDKLRSTAKNANPKTKKKDIVEKIKRLQAVCEVLTVSNAVGAEERDEGTVSPVMTCMKEPSLEAATFDIEAIIAASKTLEDNALDYKPTRSATTTTLKSVVACQEILSSTTFTPQAEVEVSLYSAELKTQPVEDRSLIPMELPLPNDESNEVSFKEQVETIYNAFRLQSEKRTKLKHAVFSWLLKNGTYFYAESTPEDRYARRERGPKWAKMRGSISEQDVLEAGLKVVKNRVKEIRHSLKIQNDKQRMHFKTSLLSWLRQLENGGGTEIAEATCMLKVAASKPVDPTQMDEPESLVRTYSTRDIEGCLLLSGRELLDTDSTLRVVGLEDKRNQSDEADSDELDIVEQDDYNIVYSNESSGTSLVQEVVIDETEGCNLLFGLFLNSLKLCQSSSSKETDHVAHVPKGACNERIRLGGDSALLSDVQLTKSETSSQRKHEHKVCGPYSMTQPVSTKAHFATKDDEGDLALVTALAEILSQATEPSEVLEEMLKAGPSNSMTSDGSRNRNSTAMSPEMDVKFTSTKDLFDKHLGGTEDVVLDETDRKLAYINSSTSRDSDKNQTSPDEDRIENSHQKQASMIKSKIYKRSFGPPDKNQSKVKVSANKTTKETRPRVRNPTAVSEAKGNETGRGREQGQGSNPSIEEFNHKRTDAVHIDQASDNTCAIIGSSTTLADKKETALTSKRSGDPNGQLQKEHNKRNAIDDVPANQSALMTTKPVRTERLRQIKKKCPDMILKVKELREAPSSAGFLEEAISGKLPTQAKQLLLKKDNLNATNQTPSFTSIEGERTKNVLTDQKGHHDETPLRNTGVSTVPMRVNPPTRRYGRSPNRKSRRSKSRRRRAPRCFQPQLSTHFETTSSNDCNSDASSNEHDEDSSDSSEDEVDARVKDDRDKDVDSTDSDENDACPRASGERVDRFQRGLSDTSSESINNLIDEKGSPKEDNVLSSLASLFSRFHGNPVSKVPDVDHEDENSESDDDDGQEDVDDESVSSSEDDSSIESGSGSSDRDDNEADLDERVEADEAETHLKHQSSDKDGDENHIEEDKPKNGENSKSGFFLSNRPLGRRHPRRLNQLTDTRPKECQQQQQQQLQSQQQLLPKKEEGRNEEKRVEHSLHQQRSSPLLMVLGENPETEVGRMLIHDSTFQDLTSKTESEMNQTSTKITGTASNSHTSKEAQFRSPQKHEPQQSQQQLFLPKKEEGRKEEKKVVRSWHQRRLSPLMMMTALGENPETEEKHELQQSQQQLFLRKKEEGRREEKKVVRSWHQRRLSPLMMMTALGENPETEVGRVLAHDDSTVQDVKVKGTIPETNQTSTNNTITGTVSNSHASKKAWYFLSRRRSDRQQHNSWNKISSENPALVQVRDDDIDYKNNNNNNGFGRREFEAEEEESVDCRDDDETFSDGRLGSF